MTRAMAQCMASSVGLRIISVSVRQNSTASSRASGARGGFLCCAQKQHSSTSTHMDSGHDTPSQILLKQAPERFNTDDYIMVDKHTENLWQLPHQLQAHVPRQLDGYLSAPPCKATCTFKL